MAMILKRVNVVHELIAHPSVDLETREVENWARWALIFLRGGSANFNWRRPSICLFAGFMDGVIKVLKMRFVREEEWKQRDNK